MTVLEIVEPGLDGVFRHVEGLVDFLLAAGVRVHLAYSSRRCSAAMVALTERVRASGGEVVDLRIGNRPECRDVPAYFRLRRMIARVRPDVVHAHSSKAGAVGRALVLGHSATRFIYSPHAYYGMGKRPSMEVRFYNGVESVLGRVGNTIAVSRDEAEFGQRALGIAPESFVVIHNPVDSVRFRPGTETERTSARLRYKLPLDAPVLGLIGRMCWQKDPETAYAAVAEVCRTHPDLHFVHVGWGEWRDYLLKLAADLGFKDRLQIIDYTDDPRSVYHTLDGLLVTSRYEAGLPLVALEALACNLPLVASTCQGMSDIGRAGLSHVWTFPPEDRPQCAAAIRAWLERHRKGEVIGLNHAQFASDSLTPERCYGAILNFYRGERPASPIAPTPAAGGTTPAAEPVLPNVISASNP